MSGLGFWFLFFEFPPFCSSWFLSHWVQRILIVAIYVCFSARKSHASGPLWCFGLMAFVSEQVDLTVIMLDHSNKCLLFFPCSIENRKEKKADSGKGVDRETCLWLDLQFIFYKYMRRVPQLLIKLLWSCIVNSVSHPKSTFTL